MTYRNHDGWTTDELKNHIQEQQEELDDLQSVLCKKANSKERWNALKCILPGALFYGVLGAFIIWGGVSVWQVRKQKIHTYKAAVEKADIYAKKYYNNAWVECSRIDGWAKCTVRHEVKGRLNIICKKEGCYRNQ